MSQKFPRILVCGGRDFFDKIKLYKTLDDICDYEGWNYEPDSSGNYLPAVHIISGKTRGADTLAVDWAVVNWCDFTEFPADWDTYGKAARYKRNSQMLEEGKPDLVVAFPGGKGTAMMIKLSKAAGVRVIEVP